VSGQESECVNFEKCGNLITPRENRLNGGLCTDCFTANASQIAREIARDLREHGGH
jgi:hypothetical protein